jgi:hypothetical protein
LPGQSGERCFVSMVRGFPPLPHRVGRIGGAFAVDGPPPRPPPLRGRGGGGYCSVFGHVRPIALGFLPGQCCERPSPASPGSRPGSATSPTSWARCTVTAI